MNQYLIVLDNPDKNGECQRLASFWMEVHGDTWEELEALAKKSYPGKEYLRDEDGSIQAVISQYYLRLMCNLKQKCEKLKSKKSRQKLMQPMLHYRNEC